MKPKEIVVMGGEERQQMVQALTDGREVAMIQPTPQVENEVVPVPAANPFWSERAQEEMRLRQSRPASLPASGGDRSGEGTRRPPSLQDLLGQEPAPVERPSSGLMGQMERGTIGGVQADEELIPDVGGEEQSEDMAVVKRALKELLVQTKELGNRLHRVEEKSYTSAASGSASRARSTGVVDANTAYPLGMTPEKQYLPGQVFYTDGMGGFWTVLPDGTWLPIEGYDLPKGCDLQSLPGSRKGDAQVEDEKEVPMMHVAEGKKPSRLPPLNYPTGGPASGGYASGPPGLTHVPITSLPPGVDGSAAPVGNQPGFVSARETATQENSAGSGGYTMVDDVPYRWKMVAGKLELEKVPLTAVTRGIGHGLPQGPGGRVSLPPGAVVPRGMPIIGDSSGTERPALGKHVMSLPTLADYTPSNPTALGDWIAMIEPMLSSLTDTGRVWWQCVYSKAYQAYAKWLSVSPLERLGIKAELEGLKVVQTVHVLLEQRAVSLLLQAIPERLKTEIVSTRMLGSVMIFYKLLTVYQPGGANERSTMLNFLVQPSPATSISEAIKGVRQWAQWRSRLRELRAVEPDATLLIKGLDGLSSALLAKHPTVHFRVASFREKLGVDYSPTSETATKLAEMLQAEFELLLHSAGEQEVKQDSDAKKRARLNKAQKGTGDETEEGDKGKGKGKRYSGDGERPFCWIYGKTDAASSDHAANFATTKTPLSEEDVLSVGPLAICSRNVHIRMVQVPMWTQILRGVDLKGILPKGERAAKVRNGEMPKRQR